jgi:alcohol dehydrogenase class IV
MLSCPPALTAACGLDAFTQLLESYVSTKASPMSDALALSGLEHFAAGFMPAYEQGASDITARSHMAYAALLSGVTLANAGLGVVHGFASPIGGYFDMPHGVVCGSLIGEATRINLEILFSDTERNRIVLEKFARVGVLLSGSAPSSLETGCERLLMALHTLIERTQIPRLGHYGIRSSDFPRILDKTTNKNSPVVLNRDQMQSILHARL